VIWFDSPLEIRIVAMLNLRAEHLLNGTRIRVVTIGGDLLRRLFRDR
jgi:hypothetical protein